MLLVTPRALLPPSQSGRVFRALDDSEYDNATQGLITGTQHGIPASIFSITMYYAKGHGAEHAAEVLRA